MPRMTQAAAETASDTSFDRGAAATAMLHHIGFTVAQDDFEELIAWYRDVLDLEINFKGSFGPVQVCFLTNDDANHRVVFVAPPGVSRDPDEAIHARLQHSAYEFPSID